MHLRQAVFVYALLATQFIPEPSFGQSSSNILQILPLQSERVFPLTGPVCGCAVFRSGSTLSDINAIVSTTLEVARVRIANQDNELRRIYTHTEGQYLCQLLLSPCPASLVARV